MPKKIRPMPLKVCAGDDAKLLARLNKHITKKGPCWEWTGCVSSGYGMVMVDGQNWCAHRIFWAYSNKTDVPQGMYLCHSCDNTRCVNPEHLRPASQKANVRECVERGRQKNTKRSECIRGHPFLGSNLYLTPDGRRQCKTCASIRNNRRSK